MSKETEPIRSRRQLREQLAQADGAAGNPPAPIRPAPGEPVVDAASGAAQPGTTPASRVSAATPSAAGVTPVPGTPDAAATGTAPVKAPAPPSVAPSVSQGTAPAAPAVSAPAPAASGAEAPRERESQTRARDRAALRAYKELLEAPAQSPLPSRRTLRQAQIDADRAPVTAVNPVISPAGMPAPAQAVRPQTQQHLRVAPAAPAKADAADSGGAAAAAQAPEKVSAPNAGQPQSDATLQDTGHVTAGPGARTRGGRRSAGPAPRDSAPQGSARQGSAAPNRGHAATPATGQHDDQASSAHAAVPPTPTVPGTQGALEPAAEKASATLAQPGTISSAEADAAQDEALAAIKAAAAQAQARSTWPLPPTEGAYEPLPGLVPGGSYYPVSAGPPPVPVAPTTEELRVLAAERAEAERAAILAERAQARERLAQESAKNRRPAADPTATNNLAMVTPLEFIEVPGAGRPVLRQPTTTHVPIVTRTTPRQAPGKRIPARPEPKAQPSATPEKAGNAAASNAAAPAPAKGPTVPNVSAARFDAALAARAAHRPSPGNRALTGGRSSTLKAAEAMATGSNPAVPAAAVQSEVIRSQMPPMPADYAHGLEPLDAVTAGLGRTQRNMLIQWGSIIVGGAALVVGLIMVLTSL